MKYDVYESVSGDFVGNLTIDGNLESGDRVDGKWENTTPSYFNKEIKIENVIGDKIIVIVERLRDAE